MNPQLYLDLLRSALKFLDRKQLSTLSAGSSQQIHSLIRREFGNKAPYVAFESLDCLENHWKYKINKESTLEEPSNQNEFYALLTNCKLIRSRGTSIICMHAPITLDFLKSINHIWTGQELTLYDEQIRPSPELYDLVSTSGDKLMLAYPGAFSTLGEPSIQCGRCNKIALTFDTLYNSNDTFPYISNIVEFLLSSDVNSHKELYLECSSPPSIQHRTEIANAIKQRFSIAANVLDFWFEWCCDVTEWNTCDKVLLNTQTKQHLIYQINGEGFSLRTLVLGTNPKDYL